jgi:hypothetical protein
MSQNRLIRSEIAQDTITILRLGNFKNRNNNVVDIQENLRYSVNKTVFYVPKHSDNLISQRDSKIKNFHTLKTEFEVTNETTLHCCNRLLNEGFSNICCLNFASAKNPGGGFIGGSQAQEESLARASGLYASIVEQKSYYEANRNDKTSFYADTDNIEEVMLNRIEKILSVAIVNGHTVLVLGAWGCGVFRNDPENVAKFFAFHLKNNSKFNNKFEKISFAVLDNSADKNNYNAFKSIFS